MASDAVDVDADGDLRETYVAAIQHDMVELDEDETLVGVVRRPTGWFRAAVEENVQAVGPPDWLLDETRERHEDLKRRGMCDEGAHNGAWEETNFADHYREYLRSDDDARAALENLADRVRDGESLVLVCFEGESKRCHRHLLVDELESRLRK